MMIQLPAFTPAMLTGFAVIGAVLVLVGLLLWMSKEAR
jgi:hypothetical protein